MLEWKAFSSVVSQADWAELACLLTNRQTQSGQEMKQYLNREIGDEQAELVMESIRGQIYWRRSQNPTGYPFNITDGNIVQRAGVHDILPYTFMLLLSIHSYYDEITISKWNEVSKLFELTVSESIRLHLGNSINIGSPRIPSEAPRSFQKCLSHVSKKINETKGIAPRISWHKDGGVDVIGWRKIDARPGKVVFLVQCATGENWETKEDIPTDSWREWILFATTPLEVLAFPSIYFAQNEYEEAWRFMCQGKLLMDRLRIANIDSGNIQANLRVQLDDWCSAQLAKLPGLS